jgi:probable HAF family extracellular repeat protein
MPTFSDRPLRVVAGAVALVVFTFVLPLSRPGTVTANGVLYTVKDLGALNCCYDWSAASAALAVNAHGDVAGVTSSPTDPQRRVPFVYQNGTMTLLSDSYGWAAGINDAGQVAGVFIPPGSLGGHAFVYQNGVFTDIGTLPGYSNQPYAVPYAINNSGTIVGDSNAAGFVYENGEMAILKRLSARTAYGVNDLGDVVGLIETVRGGGPYSDHGFLFSDNQLIDIGTLDGDTNSVSMPFGINRARQIVGVGWKNGNSEQRAFLWENGVFTELPLLEPPAGYDIHYSGATAINNRGEIIGESNASQFVYRDGTLIDLNRAIEKDSSGIWPGIWRVSAINDAGQIAGTCYFGGDGAHACLLTPVVPSAPQP